MNYVMRLQDKECNEEPKCKIACEVSHPNPDGDNLPTKHTQKHGAAQERDGHMSKITHEKSHNTAVLTTDVSSGDERFRCLSRNKCDCVNGIQKLKEHRILGNRRRAQIPRDH